MNFKQHLQLLLTHFSQERPSIFYNVLHYKMLSEALILFSLLSFIILPYFPIFRPLVIH